MLLHPPARFQCLAPDQADLDPPSPPLEHQEERHFAHATFLLLKRRMDHPSAVFSLHVNDEQTLPFHTNVWWRPVAVREGPTFVPGRDPLRLCPGGDLCDMMGR
ncbi:hypothetical protein VH569_30710 [Azospirillum sp. 11R-A]|uniref:hypothetical protein n=1 Tax=Azospirillum sp. 11R-A TaxID=3111634 RepID=UPI003C1A4CEE